MYYTNDMMHCTQKCERHENCYRYWLYEEAQRRKEEYYSCYMPMPDTDLSNCDFFINKKEYE